MYKKILALLFGIAYLIGIITIVGSDANLCSQDYLSLEFKYNNGNFSVVDKNLQQGCSPNYLHKAGFRYSYNLEGKNRSLYDADFSNLLYSDNNESGGIEDAQGNLVLAMPNEKEGEKVNLYDEGKKILEVKVYDVGATSCRI